MSAANTIGYLVMVAGGLALAASLIALAAVLVGVAGAWLFKRIRRVYRLATIHYWLGELEKRGTHSFARPDKDHP